MASRALVASLWNFAGNWGQQLSAVVIFLYLVRSLSPADFGLMALAAAAIDVMTVFGRFGQVEALMQRRFVSQRVASTSFWILVGIGTLSLVLFVAGAGLIADLLGDPRVATIILMLAPVPLIFNFTQVHEFYLRRNMQFKGIALRNVSATTIGGIAAVIAATLGYGFYALVLQKLVFTIVYAGSLAFSYRWAPSFAFSRHAASRLSRTGLDIVTANIIPMLNLRIIDVLVGTYLGVVALGFLRTAGRLYELMFQLIVSPVLAVALSALTEVKGDPERLRSTFLLYLRVALILSTPIFAAAAIMADHIILIAAGSHWEGAIVPFRLFCLGTAGLVVIYYFLPLMVSLDRTRTIRDQALFQFATTSVTTFLAAQASLFAVLVVHVVRTYLFALVNLVLVVRHSAITGRDLAREFVAPVAVSAVMGAAMMAASTALTGTGLGLYPRLALICMVGGVTLPLAVLAGERLRLWPVYSATILEVGKRALRRRRKVPA